MGTIPLEDYAVLYILFVFGQLRFRNYKFTFLLRFHQISCGRAAAPATILMMAVSASGTNIDSANGTFITKMLLFQPHFCSSQSSFCPSFFARRAIRHTILCVRRAPKWCGPVRWWSGPASSARSGLTEGAPGLPAPCKPVATQYRKIERDIRFIYCIVLYGKFFK